MLWCTALLLLHACVAFGHSLSAGPQREGEPTVNGCGHGQILETEQRLVTRSLYLRAIAQAKELLRISSSATRSLTSLAPKPAAPRVSLAFQLAGFAGNPAAAAEIESRLMPTAVKVLQKMFQVVRPTVGNLQLPSGWGNTKCIEAEVDPALIAGKGPGWAADYVLYVTSVACKPGTMAYAGVCAVGGTDSRPIMGAINLCPGDFELLPVKRKMETIVHELLHAFVFSPALFPLFLSGDPRTNITGAYGSVAGISSPSVVAALKHLSGCSSAVAAALEDEGSEGSEGSHWETRLFQGELMLAAAPFTGRSDKVPRLTLTAALLHDSGWYLPRWEVMPPLDYGAAAGCTWLSSKAKSFMSSQPQQRLYCTAAADGTAANGTTCTYDHQAVAECFKAKAEGAAGAANFLNGVAFPYALNSSSNCLGRKTKLPGTWPSLGTWQGSSSLCYTVQRITDAGGKRFPGGAACWDTTCNENGQLYVILHFPGGANQLLRCPTGKTIDLAMALPKRFISGTLQCPNNAAVCGTTADSCGACVHGYCQAGQCHCGLEYVGPACDVHVSEIEDLDAWFQQQGTRDSKTSSSSGSGGSNGSGSSGGGNSSKGSPSSGILIGTGVKDIANLDTGSAVTDVQQAGGPVAATNGNSIAGPVASGFWAQPLGMARQLPGRMTSSGSGDSTSAVHLLAATTNPVISSSVSSSSVLRVAAATGQSTAVGNSNSSSQMISNNQPLAALLALLTGSMSAETTVVSGEAQPLPSNGGSTAEQLQFKATLADHQQVLMQQLLQAGLQPPAPNSRRPGV